MCYCTAVHNMLLYSCINYITVQLYTIRYCTAVHNMLLYRRTQYVTVQLCKYVTVQLYTICYCTAVYNMLLYRCTQYVTVQLYKIYYCTAIHNTLLYSCAQYVTVQLYTIRYCTAVHNMLLYSCALNTKEDWPIWRPVTAQTINAGFWSSEREKYRNDWNMPFNGSKSSRCFVIQHMQCPNNYKINTVCRDNLKP
jgi:hypothetical protein